MNTGLALLDQAVAEHAPVAVFALFSGGHDSLVSTHLAAQHPHFSGVVHINTGVGIKETRQFVRDTCERFGWPLLEYRHDGDEYERMVSEVGFPYGEIPHRYCYVRLKERLLDRLIREHKQGWNDRIALVTGVRRSESRRRMGTIEPLRRDGATVWIAPIADLTDDGKQDYIESRGLARNPVVDHLHMSGECLCGAYAARGELEMIRFFYPEAARQIDALQQHVSETTDQWPHWGIRRPANWSQIASGQQIAMDLCQACPTRWELAAASGGQP